MPWCGLNSMAGKVRRTARTEDKATGFLQDDKLKCNKVFRCRIERHYKRFWRAVFGVEIRQKQANWAQIVWSYVRIAACAGKLCPVLRGIIGPIRACWHILVKCWMDEIHAHSSEQNRHHRKQMTKF